MTTDNNILDRQSVLSRTFSALKWFLALTVVADHFLRPIDVDTPTLTFHTHTYPLFPEIYFFIVSFLKNYAVPVFFFMSGYLLYSSTPFSTKDYLPTLRKRIRRLGIPFLIWSIFGFLTAALFAAILILYLDADLSVFPFHDGNSLNTPLLIRSLFGIRAFPDTNVPLWYMRDLILILCLIPLLHSAIRHIDWRIFTTALILIFILLFDDSDGWRFEVAALFFSTGYFLRLHDIDFIPVFKRVFPFSAALYIILGSTHFYLVYNELNPLAASVVKNINICNGVPFFIYLFYILVERGWVKGSAWFASASFFIYVTHYPLQRILYHTVIATFKPADGSPSGTVMIILSYVILVGGITALYALLHKFFPKFISLTSGGR